MLYSNRYLSNNKHLTTVDTLPSLASLSALSYFSIPLAQLIVYDRSGVSACQGMSWREALCTLFRQSHCSDYFWMTWCRFIMPVKLEECVSFISVSRLRLTRRFIALDGFTLLFPQLKEPQIHINFDVPSDRIVEHIRPIAMRCPQLRRSEPERPKMELSDGKLRRIMNKVSLASTDRL